MCPESCKDSTCKWLLTEELDCRSLNSLRHHLCPIIWIDKLNHEYVVESRLVWGFNQMQGKLMNLWKNLKPEFHCTASNDESFPLCGRNRDDRVICKEIGFVFFTPDTGISPG